MRGFRQGDVAVFKGIRYGADTARYRFQPPRPRAPWQETRTAFEYAPSAPQDGGAGTISEDCLFLNVWTAAARTDAPWPVMFYLHGRAYSHGSGSSPLYDGAKLASRHDVVVVTVNHRLNAFGYLYLQRFPGALSDSGNVGQLDVILALGGCASTLPRSVAIRSACLLSDNPAAVRRSRR